MNDKILHNSGVYLSIVHRNPDDDNYDIFWMFVSVESDLEDIDAVPPSDDAKEFMQWIRSTLAKYWILLCCAAFLLVALQKDVSLYQIFYMVTFLIGFIVYQV